MLSVLIAFVVAAVWIKWRRARQQLIGQNAHGPVVYFVIVRRLCQQLRCQVVRSTTEGHATLIDRMRGPAKVAKFDEPTVAPAVLGFHIGRLSVRRTALKYKNVFGLDISVDHIPLLAKVQGRHDLLDDRTSNGLLESTLST